MRQKRSALIPFFKVEQPETQCQRAKPQPSTTPTGRRTSTPTSSTTQMCQIQSNHQSRTAMSSRPVFRLRAEAAAEDEDEGEAEAEDAAVDAPEWWTDESEGETDPYEHDDYPSDSETTKELREKKHLKTRGCFKRRRK